MDKCSSVIVTYYPDTTALNSLARIAQLCHKIFIIDNTPSNITINFPNLENATVIRFGDNLGLAKGLNKGIELAGKAGIENIFLFDQDSRVPPHFFRDMLNFKAEVDSKVSNSALFVPNFFDRNSETFARFPLITRFTVKHASCDEIHFGPNDCAIIAITSGSLLRYSTYRELGPFRDDYFIDFIDNEYCLRLSKLGYRIAINCDVTLDHAIGYRSIHRFLGLTIKPNFHSDLRRYYIARNGVRTALDYACYYPSYIPLILARMAHEVLSIVLFENNRSAKLRAMLYGLYHGFLGRMGKCQVESLISNAG